MATADAATAHPNVLYVVSDDLRAELPGAAYGHDNVHAPNLAKLASESLVFDAAFCNQPVCSPSRNSFMSGRRPSTTKIWNFIGSFRDSTPSGATWVTLPSQFKDHGYLTLGTGKLFHPAHPVNGDGNLSWNNATFTCTGQPVGGAGTYCNPGAASCNDCSSCTAPNPRWCTVDAPLNGSGSQPPLADAETLADARLKLCAAFANLEKTKQPFFVGVGFHLPHLDWQVPSGWLAEYPPTEQIPLAKHRVAQAGRPPVSIHCPYDGADFEKRWHEWGYTNPWQAMTNSSAQEMRKFYWASVSYLDYAVGELLGEVEAAGVSESTIVVFHSDHGWSLGENGEWVKFALTEVGTRVPLMIKVPFIPASQGRRTRALVELVDIMPTLAGLGGLPPPVVHAGEPPLDGISLLPLFGASPPSQLKHHVWQQHPRCPINANISTDLWERNLCINIPASQFGWMGYSLRNTLYRYTAWFVWNGTSLAPILPAAPVNGTDRFYNELYRYSAADATNDYDTLETVDFGGQLPEVVAEMHTTLVGLITQNT